MGIIKFVSFVSLMEVSALNMSSCKKYQLSICLQCLYQLMMTKFLRIRSHPLVTKGQIHVRDQEIIESILLGLSIIVMIKGNPLVEVNMYVGIKKNKLNSIQVESTSQ